MPRPRVHNSQAERAAAYRARLKDNYIKIERTGFDAREMRLRDLQTQIAIAADADNRIAKSCFSEDIDTMLENLIATFSKLST